MAVGGDASPERLLLAYAQGIFPWPQGDLPLLWFSPEPRFVLPLDAVHLPTSLRKFMRKEPYRVTMDTAFESVMLACADKPRPGQDGTWITDELVDGYTSLHKLGFAHSIEAWQDDTLVGGLYGVSLGGVFCGESMFADEKDASKIAFSVLLATLRQWKFDLVDCQVRTEHLERFGATQWPREQYLDALRTSLQRPTRRGRWACELTCKSAETLL